MTNQALIYHRPSKWPIATALGAAVLIHLSAIAVAFHREPTATEPAIADDSVSFGFEPAEDPSIPPDPDLSLPPAPPPPTAEFVEARDMERALKPHQTPAPVRASGQTHLPAVGNVKAWAISAPRPDYPYEARSHHITGSGIAIISVDPITGFTTDVTMEQSIRHSILDNSTVSAFRRWRFKPDSPSRVRIPITFLLTGAQY
jgi:TonB family protein